MKRSRKTVERIVKAKPSDLVSFSVVCAPASGATLDEMRRRLSVRTAREYLPHPETRRKVIRDLKAQGFEVFDSPGPVVTARGPVRLFTRTFGGQFVKRVRTRSVPGAARLRRVTSIELRKGSELATSRRIPDALLIAVARKPKLAIPSLPPLSNVLALHLPGDVAQLTRASATHRRTANGTLATGSGVTVAVIDSGFADHPYYREHDYRITRMAASDVTSDPSEDEEDHGTWMLAGVLACAPDAHVLAIKYDNPITALNDALAKGAQIVSLSWGVPLDEGLTQLPESDDVIPLHQTLVTMVATGITVVAAAGNGGDLLFPAMMPDVIAVGGVAVGPNDSLSAWSGGSSFESLIFTDRRVPDLCGIASKTLVPLPPDVYPSGWETLQGATSFATSQVAGVAALLLQKSPTLTPEEIRQRLTATATDVKSGHTFTGDRARRGRDLATGAGLVNALAAWNSVA